MNDAVEDTDRTPEIIKKWQEKLPDRNIEIASETGDLL